MFSERLRTQGISGGKLLEKLLKYADQGNPYGSKFTSATGHINQPDNPQAQYNLLAAALETSPEVDYKQLEAPPEWSVERTHSTQHGK